jgi:protein disulfide-isomerase A6
VVKLTADNFSEKVLDSNEPWLVEFFAPWCGHCKNLVPAWEGAAKKLKGKVNLGTVDATVEASLATEYGVKGYPTIKAFRAGSAKTPMDYNGGRTVDQIVSYALSQLYEEKENSPPKEVNELVDVQTFEAACNPPNLCVISFLPDLLDTGASGRNAYLQIVRSVAEKQKRQPLTFLWASAMAQSVCPGEGFGCRWFWISCPCCHECEEAASWTNGVRFYRG